MFTAGPTARTAMTLHGHRGRHVETVLRRRGRLRRRRHRGVHRVHRRRTRARALSVTGQDARTIDAAGQRDTNQGRRE